MAERIATTSALKTFIIPLSTLAACRLSALGVDKPTSDHSLRTLVEQFCVPLFEIWRKEFVLFGTGTDTPEKLADEYLRVHAEKRPGVGAIPQIFFAINERRTGDEADDVFPSSNGESNYTESRAMTSMDFQTIAPDAEPDSLPPDLLSPTLAETHRIIASIGIDNEDLAPDPKAESSPTHPYAHVGPWLQTLFVLPAARGFGVASHMLKYAMGGARNVYKLRWLWLYTDFDGPYAMVQTYKKHGFKLIESFAVPWLDKVEGKECSAVAIMRIDWGWTEA